MDILWEHYAEWNKPVTKRQLNDSNEVTRAVKVIETESRTVKLGRMGIYCLMVYWVSVLQDEKNSGDGWWW